MAKIVSKLEYAQHLGVRPSAVSNYIARGKLIAPALRPDGKINLALADRQLGIRLDLVKSVGQGDRAETMARPSPASSDPVSNALARARVMTATAAAEKARRQLNESRGRYVLAADASAEWSKVLGEIVQGFEQGIAGLPVLLGLDPDQATALHQWWREHRELLADRLASEAASAPEFVEDVAA